MARCQACNSVVTKTDVVCYGCGDPIPVSHRRPLQPKRISKVSNIAFFCSLGLTAFSFLSERKLPLSISMGLSGLLLTVRIIADRIANKTPETN